MRFIINVYLWFAIGVISGLVYGHFPRPEIADRENFPVVVHVPDGYDYDSTKTDSLLLLTSSEMGLTFTLDSVITYQSTKTMSDLHNDLLGGVLHWQPSKSVKGKINFYYVSGDCGDFCFDVAQGLAPSLTPENWDGYEFGYLEDIIFRLDQILTLKTHVHELGHFFGLGHRWKCLNWMSYENCATMFDSDQLDTINLMQGTHRNYLKHGVLAE